jgi:hypothetical protein
MELMIEMHLLCILNRWKPRRYTSQLCISQDKMMQCLGGRVPQRQLNDEMNKLAIAGHCWPYYAMSLPVLAVPVHSVYPSPARL